MELRAGIRKRGDSYQFVVSVGFDGNGKQVRKYGTFTPKAGMTEKQEIKAVNEAFDDFRSFDASMTQNDSKNISKN